MLDVHQRAWPVRVVEGRQDFLEEASAEMISSAGKTKIHDAGKQVESEIIDAQISEAVGK